MTEGRTLPQIFYFALPLLMGNLLQQTYSMVDAAIVGTVMSLSLAVITALLCGWILRLIRTPENIFDDAYYYLLVTFIGIPCTFYYNLLSSVIRALGDSKTPFWFLLFSTVLNILLDLFCILVLGWGVAGAAIATLIAQGVSAILCYFYMMRHFDILRTTPAERRFDGRLARTMLSIGVPMGLQFSITAIGSIMLQSANNALGTACVAAYSAAIRIKMFFMCPFESLGIAMATFAGQNYGAGKPERIWLGVKSSALMMMIYWAFTFCVLMPGSRMFVRLFVDASEVEILADAVLFLHAAVCFFPVLGLLCILRYTIQGSGFTNLAMLSGCRLLRRSDGLGLCRCFPHSRFHLCLSKDETDGFHRCFLIRGISRGRNPFLKRKSTFRGVETHFLKRKSTFRGVETHFLKRKSTFRGVEIHFLKRENAFRGVETHFLKRECVFRGGEPIFCIG